jgi:hypothetical protein
MKNGQDVEFEALREHLEMSGETYSAKFPSAVIELFAEASGESKAVYASFEADNRDGRGVIDFIVVTEGSILRLIEGCDELGKPIPASLLRYPLDSVVSTERTVGEGISSLTIDFVGGRVPLIEKGCDD